MADFECCIRTNYFRVKDEKKLRDILSTIEANGEIKFWDAVFEEQKCFCFGCNGDIWGSDSDTCNFEDDLAEIGKILPDKEALVLIKVGHEKLRYLCGIAYIVTNQNVESIDLEGLAIDKAKEMLNDRHFQTQTHY